MRKIFNFRPFGGYLLLEPLAVLLVISVMGVTSLSTPRYEREMDKCTKNQRQLSVEMMMYIEENNYVFPGQTAWEDIALTGRVLQCPTAGEDVTNAYAYNANLAGVSFDSFDDPEDYIILFADSDREDNMMHSMDDIAFRHEWDSAIISFLDGHVSWYCEYEFDYLRFK